MLLPFPFLQCLPRACRWFRSRRRQGVVSWGQGRGDASCCFLRACRRPWGPRGKDGVPECLLTRTACVSGPPHALAVPVAVRRAAEPPSPPPPDPWRGWVSHGADGGRGQPAIHFVSLQKAIDWNGRARRRLIDPQP